MNRALQGCQVPIGAYALVQGEEVWLRGLVGSPDGARVIRDEIRGPWQRARHWATPWPSACWPPVPTLSWPRSTGHECSTAGSRSSARSAPDGPLVVRPAAQANQLVQMLRQLGHAPLCCPLLETRPGCDLPHLGDMLREADLVIAVSMHAVHFAHHFLLQTGQTWPHIDYFAVGQASADAFAEAGIQALCPADPRSEGLLAPPALQG